MLLVGPNAEEIPWQVYSSQECALQSKQLCLLLTSMLLLLLLSAAVL
jgi:hypothetical protein